MTRVRKLAVDLDAHRWHQNGDHPDDRVGETEIDPLTNQPYERLEGAVVRFFRHPQVPGGDPCERCDYLMHDHGWIDTLEGGHTVCPGDWIVTGVVGEHYPVKPFVFEKTYEVIE
jgi:hypothetical protein